MVGLVIFYHAHFPQQRVISQGYRGFLRVSTERKTSMTTKCRGTSLIRKHLPAGPYSSPMPRALW